jgi:predicted dehydrogenase
MRKLKIAVIGCGAVTEFVYLPTITTADQFDVAVLVDSYLARAQKLADKHSVPAVGSDYRDVFGKVEAAIVAVPHYLHAPVTIDLLQQGIHVLVEKPMALKASDCQNMIATADKTGTVLAVGLVRRFYQASQFVKRAIENGVLGNIVRFDFREGGVYSWPAVSREMFQTNTGGGVLTGVGAHILDILLWWLGDYDTLKYYDDASGGVEADCEIQLQMRCGALGVVELSRTRNLRNTFILYGDRAELEVGTNPSGPVRLKTGKNESALIGEILRNDRSEETVLDAFRSQLDDFAAAMLNNRPPFVPGREGKRAVEIVEVCQASREFLKQPWIFPDRPDWNSSEGSFS